MQEGTVWKANRRGVIISRRSRLLLRKISISPLTGLTSFDRNPLPPFPTRPDIQYPKDRATLRPDQMGVDRSLLPRFLQNGTRAGVVNTQVKQEWRERKDGWEEDRGGGGGRRRRPSAEDRSDQNAVWPVSVSYHAVVA